MAFARKVWKLLVAILILTLIQLRLLRDRRGVD